MGVDVPVAKGVGTERHRYLFVPAGVDGHFGEGRQLAIGSLDPRIQSPDVDLDDFGSRPCALVDQLDDHSVGGHRNVVEHDVSIRQSVPEREQRSDILGVIEAIPDEDTLLIDHLPSVPG